MPHFTLEYSANLDSLVDIASVVEVVRKGAVETEIFPLGGIRVRAIRCEQYAIADGRPDYGFIAMLLRLGEGRDLAARKRAGEHIFRTLSEHLDPVFAAIPLRCRSTCRSTTRTPVGSATLSTTRFSDWKGSFKNRLHSGAGNASEPKMTSSIKSIRNAHALPTPVFDPPFNIIRCSHAVLDVVDLGASRAFYENAIGLHVEDGDDRAVYLRGNEEHQHHSLVLRKAPVAACHRLGFKVGNEQRLDKAAAFLSENGIVYGFAEPPFQGRTLQFTDPYGFQIELYARWTSARICCGATISTGDASRSGSTISTYSPPKSRTPSTSTRGWVSGSPSMARRTGRMAASRRRGCIARAMCTILRSPTAGALACTTSPIGCRPR